MAAIRTRTSAFRKMSMLGFEMVGGGHNFFALLEFDITDVRRELRAARAAGGGGSLFAFMLKAIAACLGEFPAFNAMANLRRTTRFSEVDIDVPVEINNDGEVYNKQCIIRDVNAKSIAQVDAEIAAAKAGGGEEMSYMASRFGRRLITTLPAWLTLFVFRRILNNHLLVKKLSGTAFVTSVSMFSTVPGYIIPFIGGPKAASFAIGSAVKKPVVIRDRVEIREMLNVTAIFNHDLVDGAPAARFVNKLRRLTEREYRTLWES
jgi:pyruvate/2-oxoglutarate dehydrogenase complex dihydrolipoamide acyltransferase (E2) component